MPTISVHLREYISKPSKRSEQHILNLPWDSYRAKVAYEYAKKVLEGRFVKAERFIKKYPLIAAKYARYVIKGPWRAAERLIRTDMAAFYYYSKYVKKDIKGAEQVVKCAFKEGQINDVFMYCLYVRRKRWSLVEELVEQHEGSLRYWVSDAVRYVEKIKKSRWEAIEESVLDDYEQTICNYASILSPSEKEEFHNKILMKLIAEPKPSFYSRGIDSYAKKTKLVADPV